MAIRVLIDYEVPPENIIMCCLIASPQGLLAISSMFPKLKIVTSEVDWNGINERFHLVPGLGNFGDRYFGTE